MSDIFPKVVAEKSIFWSWHDALVSRLLMVLQAIDQSILRHRDEAILRSLDRRLLEDAGIEPIQNIEIAQDHVSKSHFLPLSEPFSWTRFGK